MPRSQPTDATRGSCASPRRSPGARAALPVRDQLADRYAVGYGDYLTWRGLLEREPPRRPDPDRPAGPASARTEPWKFGFVASRCTRCEAVSLPPQRVCVGLRRGRRDPPTSRSLTIIGTIRTFTIDRLALLAGAAGDRRRRRLRRRRPLPVRARPTPALSDVVGRRPRRDDVPPPLHRRRRPQLLLEGQTERGGSDGEQRDQGSRSRSSAWAARGSPSTGTSSIEDLIVDATTECFDSVPAVTRDDGRCVLGRHHGLRPVRAHAQPAAEDPVQAGHAGRELLRHGVGVVSQRLLRGRLRRLRLRDGGRRRETEGLRHLRPGRRPARARRNRTGPERAGDVLAARPCLSAAVRRRRRGSPRRADPHRVEEPPQRRTQRARAVSQGSRARADRGRAARRREASGSSTARASPTAPQRRSSSGPRTLTATPTRRST